MNTYSLLLTAVGATAQRWTYQNPSLMTEGVSISINPDVKDQTMVGGGCSGAFGIACQQFGSVGLSPERSELVTQTLFDENIGGLYGEERHWFYAWRQSWICSLHPAHVPGRHWTGRLSMLRCGTTLFKTISRRQRQSTTRTCACTPLLARATKTFFLQ